MAVIEQNADGSATINFENGGQHTVKGAGSAEALRAAYGDLPVVRSDRTADQQSSWREETYGAQEKAAREQYYEAQIQSAKDITPEVNLTDDQYQAVLRQNNAPEGSKSAQIALQNAILGLSMGLSFEDATDMSADGGFYNMLREVRSGNDTWTKNPTNLSPEELKTPAGKLAYLNRKLGEVFSVGNNVDTRDFRAAVTSGDAIKGLQVANNQMFGGINVRLVPGVDGGNSSLNLVGGNGTTITGVPYTTFDAYEKLSNFGVRDLSWSQGILDQLSPAIPEGTPQGGFDADIRRQQGYRDTLNFLKDRYNPFEGKEGLFDKKLATISLSTVAPTVSPTTAPTVAPPATPQEVRQTMPSGVSTPTVKPTYGQTPITPPQGPQTTTPSNLLQTPQSPFQTTPSMLQTAGLSAVPDKILGMPDYTGTTLSNLTMPSQGQQSIQSVMYRNDMGQTVTVTEINGQPTTYVPPGFRRVSTQGQEAPIAGVTPTPQFAEGGSVGEDRSVDAMYRMASQFLGYKGPKTRKGLEEFAKSSPGAASKMKAYTSAMAKGGLVKGYQEGGMVTPTVQNAQIPATPAPLAGQIRQDQLADMSGNLMRQTLQPIQAPTSFIQPQEADFIAPTAGMTVPQAPFAESATVDSVEQASLPQVLTPATFTPTMAAPAVAQETANLQAAQGQVSQGAQVQGAQQEGTAVSNLEAAQGEAIKMNNPMQREIQAGELISGSAVDATKVEALNSQMQAAEATPSSQATVQGQLEGLMTQFEGGKVPAWAAGAMRGAMAQLSARGLGASSLAGQAVVQAAMESAIPIAQVDAQTRAQFESQNLSNRQQTAMAAAQQRANFLQIEFDQEFQSRVQNSARIADIANMNFTAEQQIALENSRNANTVNLQNLGNRQAMTMAEAASLANLDMANLNNRQQAAVQNAQNFLQMDLTNLNNEQQTELFKTQQNIQSLFTDQAAENASLQFNAASENQTKQFFSNLTSQVGQFNATQRNAMDQFNVNSVNAMRQFNSEVQQQRDLFNAQNGLVIAQANAQWRQNIATLNTSAQNQSNMDFAKTINGLTAGNLDQVWQRERDIMSYSFAQSESKQDRALSILLADKDLAAYREKMAQESDDAKAAVFTRLLFGS